MSLNLYILKSKQKIHYFSKILTKITIIIFILNIIRIKLKLVFLSKDPKFQKIFN